MRLVLHIGQSKTGSTALQKRLLASAGALRQSGILYPRSNGRGTHEFLTLPLSFEQEGPRLLRRRLHESGVAPSQAFDRKWDALRAEMAEARLDCVVMSSEYLFTRLGLPGTEGLVDLLAGIFTTVDIYAYLRRPSQHYASMVQQRVKHAPDIVPPAPSRYRRQIESWERWFPGRVHLRVYDRAGLRNGDIAEDFCHWALGPDPLPLAPPGQANVAMSAEAAALMQDLQIEAARLGPEGKSLLASARQVLLAADAAIGPAPPVLLPGLASYLDHASVDLLWLREARGMVFPGVAYDRIGPLPRPEGRFERIGDVLRVDPARLWRLQSALAGMIQR